MQTELNPIFAAHGFGHRPTPNEHLGTEYVRPISTSWLINVHALWVQTPTIDIGLKPPNEPYRSIVGTVHRFHSSAALARDLRDVVTRLEGLAAQPEHLVCPECKTRMVHMKEGRHAPFLSCDGMVIAGSKPNRGPLCRGTSNAIPALLDHG